MRSVSPSFHSKRLLVVGSVVGAHVLGLWAMQSGLVRRVVDEVLPDVVMAELIEAPQPVVPPAPPPPAPPPPAPVPPPPAPTRPQSVAKPTPSPVPVAETPTPLAQPEQPPPPIAAQVAEPAAQAAVPAPVAPPAPPAAPRIELPSSSADYLNNPPPPYPPLSKRLGEQGKVVVRVFITATGEATQAEIRTSSGYERLDQTALQTVQRWRYVPGKRNGVAEGMWFNVPIQFVLE